MALYLKIDTTHTEIGSRDFFHSFFSTISYRLEPLGWGTRFPVLLNELYQGTLSKTHAVEALHELDTIALELKQFPPSQVVWDVDDLAKQPPWGSNISPDITDLSNYFITSTGRDLIITLRECIEYFSTNGSVCQIISD